MSGPDLDGMSDLRICQVYRDDLDAIGPDKVGISVTRDQWPWRVPVTESGWCGPDSVDLAGHRGVGTPARRSALGRRPVAQRRMAVSVVVVGLEVVDDHAGLEQRVRMVAVEALLPQAVVEQFDVGVDPQTARRNVDQAGLVLAEPLQRLRIISGPLSSRSTFGDPPVVAKTFSSSSTRSSPVIERSTMFSSETRVCSSIIEAILMALPSNRRGGHAGRMEGEEGRDALCVRLDAAGRRSLRRHRRHQSRGES